MRALGQDSLVLSFCIHGSYELYSFFIKWEEKVVEGRKKSIKIKSITTLKSFSWLADIKWQKCMAWFQKVLFKWKISEELNPCIEGVTIGTRSFSLTSFLRKIAYSKEFFNEKSFLQLKTWNHSLKIWTVLTDNPWPYCFRIPGFYEKYLLQIKPMSWWWDWYY